MILINSAEFDYAEIDLEKDLFFAGDNGTGKTSTIIALFYLFSGDNNSRKLGISSDKKTFKEYYFPDERASFLIYEFEDFFIFMYKQNSEVFKFFSQQNFDINEIIEENGQLKPFKEIQTYLKSAPLKYLAKSSEYRTIIYGQNRNYLDFKITTIKNYDVFIELFNQTFNVDKSIVDTNSIKRAIQKSLNIEEKNIEFNYQHYIDEIKKFQDTYIFFRNFEKEHNRIEKTIELKEKLLADEDKLEQLKSSILYRKAFEIELLSKRKEEREQFEKESQNFEKQLEKKNHSIGRCEKRFLKRKIHLESDIHKIEKLKEKFSPKIYQKQQNLYNKQPYLEQEQADKQTQLTLLEANILNAVESIDADIRTLKVKIEREIPNEKSTKKEQITRKYQEEKEQLKEQQRHEKEIKQHKIDTKKERITYQIDELREKRESQHATSSSIHEKYRQSFNEFREHIDEERELYQKQKEESQEQQRISQKQLKELDEQSREIQKDYKKKHKNISSELWEKRSKINQTIRENRAILLTPKGSFKEFLQQSGLSWERELYPIMDVSLLTMDSQKLQPKIVEQPSLLSIKMQTHELKSIPTQEEAEQSIALAKQEKKEALNNYKNLKVQLKEEVRTQLQSLNKERNFINYELENRAKKIKGYQERLMEIKTITLPSKERELKEFKERELSAIKSHLQESENRIKELKKELNSLNQELQSFYTRQKKELQQQSLIFSEQEREEIKHLDRWFNEQKEKITLEIKEAQKSKNSLTKDEKITLLRVELNQIKSQLNSVQEAKQYLEEYDKEKSLISKLESFKSELEILIENHNNFAERIKQKRVSLLEQQKQLQERLVKIKSEMIQLEKGIKRGEEIKIENITPKKSNIYLNELLEQYRSIDREYRDNRVTLKELLTRLNGLKGGLFLDISFRLSNFNNFQKLSEDNETLEKLYELQAFKEQKFTPIKETTNEEYLNFIQNEIPSKLGSLSNSEENFQEQVKKINNNLANIDFSIVKDIKIRTEVGSQRSVLKLLTEMKRLIENLTITDNKSSLFFDKPQTNQNLQKISTLLSEIKSTLNGGAITLLDTIDLSLEFTENGKLKKDVTQIKNDSSTGGTILLKMALAVSILGLYTQEKESTFFLILDEVSRLHSHNQDLLRNFANSRGFRIVFVTPEPVYAKPDEIKYYKFQRRDDSRFEIIGLNL